MEAHNVQFKSLSSSLTINVIFVHWSELGREGSSICSGFAKFSKPKLHIIQIVLRRYLRYLYLKLELLFYAVLCYWRTYGYLGRSISNDFGSLAS